MSRRTRRLALLAVAAAGSAAALPAAAQAETYCVNTPSCLFGTVKPDIQAAIDAAEADGNGSDVIRIGPKATPYAGPFAYDDGGGGGKLTIEGAGIGQTVLSNPSGAGHTLALGNAESVVKHLTLRTPSGGNAAALWLDGGSADGVRVEQAGSTFDQAGVMLHGAGSTFAGGEIAMSEGAAVRTHTNVSGLRVDRSTITGRGGVEVSTGSSMTVDRSTIDTSRGAGSVAGGLASLTVTNSAIRMGNAAGGDTALWASGNGTLTAVHVTLLGSGSGNALGASSSANGWTATAQIRNSVISGFSRYAACSGDNGGSATLTLQYTSATDSALTSDPDCSFTAGAGTQLGVISQFAGGAPGADLAAADLRLKAPSPLIDAGDTNGILTTDLAGLSRPVDGDGVGGAKVDLGAIEYRREAPLPALAAPASVQTGEQAAMTAAGTTDPDGDTLSYAWSFGDGTTATGLQAQHTYATPGAKTVTLTVTDAAGRTATKTATIQVTAPPAPPAPPAEPATSTPTPEPAAPSTGSGGGSQGTAPVRDTTAPRLGALHAMSRATLGGGRSTLTRRGADLRFTLGERATVTIALTRGGRTWTLVFRNVPAGTVRIALGRRSGLGRGRYTARITARNAAGNRSAALKGTLRLR